MRTGTSIGIKPLLNGLEGFPIDEAGGMLLDEHTPLVHRKMTQARLDGALFIDIPLAPALALGVSASIRRIGQNVMNRGVSRNHPTHHPARAVLQWEAGSFRPQP